MCAAPVIIITIIIIIIVVITFVLVRHLYCVTTAPSAQHQVVPDIPDARMSPIFPMHSMSPIFPMHSMFPIFPMHVCPRFTCRVVGKL